MAALAGGGPVGSAWALSSGGSRGSLTGRVRVVSEAGPTHEAALLESSGVFALAVRTVNYELRCRAI